MATNDTLLQKVFNNISQTAQRLFSPVQQNIRQNVQALSQIAQQNWTTFANQPIVKNIANTPIATKEYGFVPPQPNKIYSNDWLGALSQIAQQNWTTFANQPLVKQIANTPIATKEYGFMPPEPNKIYANDWLGKKTYAPSNMPKTTPVLLKDLFNPKSLAGGGAGQAITKTANDLLTSQMIGNPGAIIGNAAKFNPVAALKGLGTGLGVQAGFNYLSGEKQNLQTLGPAAVLGTAMSGFHGQGELTPKINNTAEFIRNRVSKEDVKNLGAFAEIVETKGAKADTGEFGQYAQAFVGDLFGKKETAGWSTLKVKNVIDAVLGKISTMDNTGGLGLSTKNIELPKIKPTSKIMGVQPTGGGGWDVKKLANEAGVSEKAKVQTIPLNKISGTDYPELDEFLKTGKKLTPQEANDLIGRLENPITQKRKIDVPISVYDNGNGTYSLQGGNNRIAQALVNGDKNIVATSNNFKVGQSLEDYAKSLSSQPTGGGGAKIPLSGQTLPEQGGQIPVSPKVNPLKGQVKVSLPPIINPNVKERGFVTSVKETPQVSQPVKTATQGVYIPKPNEQLMGEVKALLNEGASIKFNNVEGLDKKVAATIQEAINADKAGNHELAANLYNNLAEHGTELGRSVQAFSMIDKMSPEAIALSAAKKIQNYNKTAIRKIPELGADQVKIISEQVSKIDKLAGREKNIAINQLSETINNFIPSSIADKAITLWKAGLLTSLRTHERNLLGNTIMGAAEIAKDPFASGADILMSLKTGKRSMTSTLKGSASGFSKGVLSGKDIIQYGFDPEQAISKFEVKRINWGNSKLGKVLKAATEAVFRPLGAADKPFWQSSYARSLYDQAGAEAINAGKQGNKIFIENLVSNPTEQMLKTAFNDANYATFHDKNALSSVANTIKRAAQRPENGAIGSELGKVATEVVAPFTRVPSSIVDKTIAYSPIGLIKGAAKVGVVLAGKVPELQRQAAQEIGRGVIGTGLFGLGAYLMSKGLMTGQPKDAKESALWQAEGKQANSVLIGGKWRSINSIGPQNLVMLAGAKYQEEMGKPEGSIGSYAGGVAKDQLSQTFFSGVQGLLNAITDPNRYGKSYLGNQAASVIPNIVKDTSKAFDPNARETNTVGDYMKLGIPGLRNTLLPKRDVLGNVVPQEPTGIGAFIDLFNSKTPIDNAVVNELTRLNSVGNDTTPSKLGTNQTILKQKVKLTFEQLNNLEAGVGEALRPQLQTLITSPAYQQLDDETKAKAIDRVVQDVRSKYKNLNAGAITSGTTPINTLQSGNLIPLVQSDGSLKMIDTSFQPTKPTLTGLAEIDKLAISKYNSEIKKKIDDIYALALNKQITVNDANTQIAALKASKASTIGGTTLKVPKPTLKKTARIKVKKIKLAKLKIKKPKKIKLISPAKLKFKVLKAKKGGG